VATSADLAILGAGPAGLAAAWRAAREGHSVVVLERAAAVGGMAASFDVAGVRVDHGSHRLHPATEPRVLAALEELLGDDLQRRPRNGRIRLDGRWIGFPLRTGELVRRLPPAFAVRAARDAVLSPARRAREDTFAAEAAARVGLALAERFYGPYARKLWGAEPEELSGEHARRRISSASPWALAARVVRRRSPDWFWYPRRGFGQIVDALAHAATAAGADIRLGAPVERMTVGEGVTRLTTAAGAGAGAGREVHARHVWSTLPLPVLAAVAGGPVAPRLEHRAMTLVYLALDRRRWTAFDAHYLPGPETIVSRVSEPRNYRDGPDPDDRTVLCAEIPCAVGDEVWSAPAVDLGERVARDLAGLGLPATDHFDVEVCRLPAAYPVYRPGFERELREVEAWVRSLPGVISLGRHGLHAHDNTHHALATAWAAADALGTDGSFDGHTWARSLERFRAHVVED
jgi:protoporphyrinogen oxidase